MGLGPAGLQVVRALLEEKMVPFVIDVNPKSREIAKQMGVEVRRGDPRDNKPGTCIVIPAEPAQLAVSDIDLDHVRRSYLRNALDTLAEGQSLSTMDIEFLAAETRTTPSYVEEVIDALRK